jgi:hypothetical protein
MHSRIPSVGNQAGKRGFAWIFLAMALLLMLPSRTAFAQYDLGGLVGTIHDSSGAAVPNVTVTVTNDATGIATVVKTDQSGDYEVPSLRVGVYTISASASGFSIAEAKQISISVGGRERIDLVLKVGAAQATTVEVSGVALQLETESSQRDQTITGYQSAALPLVSRNYTDLLALVSGVRQAPTQATTTSNINSPVRAGAYNVNGQRSVFNNFMLDGMDNNSYGESNQGFDNQIISVPPDSVDQFSVVTNNESAEYGRSSGATINVASLSGGNKFHATLYEFLRNTDLNATGFFKPTVIGTNGPVPFVKPPYHRNQYGGDFGGPILHDKMFFFLDYEGLRAINSPLFVLTLPTQNELKGIFVVPVQNATTGTVYPAGTAIPSGAINPLAAQVVAAFQKITTLPVSGVSTTGVNSGDYPVFIPFRDYSDKGDLRLDYQASPSARYFLRVSDRKETEINFPTIPLPLEGQTAGPQRILDQQIAVGYTGTFGANRILDLRLGISRTKAGKTPLSEGTAPVLVNGSPIPGLPTAPAVAGGLPAISITGGFTAFGRQTTNPQFQDPALLDPKANFTWVKGNHSFKFGYEYEHIWMGVLDNNPLYGSYTFGGGYSACPNGAAIPGGGTCSSAAGTPLNESSAKVSGDTYFADFLFGTSSAYALANYFEAHLRQTIESVYAQDDWKVMPNLTLNLGLRWEYGSPYSEQHNYVSNWDPTSQTVFTLNPNATLGNGITPTTGSGVYGKTLVNPDLSDFAPRVGFAFAPYPKMTLRGGFGTSYVHYTRAGSGDIQAINAPQAQFAAVSQISPTTSNHCSTPLPAQIIATGTTAESCYVTADQGFPSGLVTSFNYATDNITWVPKNTRDSYVENFYLAVQQQITKNSLLDIAYVGNHGLKLQGFINGNQRNISSTGTYSRPFANWPSDITEALNEFYSNYNALQVRYEQRMVAGLTLLNSFTWEHSLDNASASLEGNTPSVQDANHLSADYGQSDYNLPLANITSLVYDLPFGHGRTYAHDLNPIADAVLGGWQVSAINTAQAGTPFNLEYGPNSAQLASTQIPSNQNYRGANLYRPNLVPGVPLTQGRSVRVANSGAVQYINFNAVQIPAIDNASGILQPPFGNMSRNPGRTPPLYQTDLDFNKRFSLPKEGMQIEFRSELYNIFNHTNLYLPATSNPDISGTQAANASLGLNNASGGGQTSSTFTPRVIQFALKLIY